MSKDIQEFLSTYPDPIAALAKRLRADILTLAPNSVEKLHQGWKVMSYRGPKKVICSIAPHKNWVNVQFMEGTSLEDPNGLLIGTGKTMRHVTISQATDIDKGLSNLVIQAVKRAE